MEANLDYIVKYGKWIDKKLQGKPISMQILPRRTVNIAITVLSAIKGIPFSDLSCALYFFCQDVDVKHFTRQYEAQLELAGANEEAFVKGLHKFYNDMARKIKDEQLYQAFFEFISACLRTRYDVLPDKSDVATRVIDCYTSLLLQQTEYLRPNKFDLSSVVCGLTTTGEVMSTPDSFPNFDVPAIELAREVRAGKIPVTQAELDKRISALCEKYGYSGVRTLSDVEMIANADRLFTNHQCALLPYINEYTFDMLPENEHLFSGFALPLYALRHNPNLDASTLQECLRHRARTLPSNGVAINLSGTQNLLPADAQVYRSVKMKELLYGDAIIMLYKVDTASGQLCGHYNTQDGFLFSILQEGTDKTLFEGLRLLLLYLYASQVTRNGTDMLKSFSENFWYVFDQNEYTDKQSAPFVDIEVHAFGRGGRPENTYAPDIPQKTGARAGNDAYESEQRAIQGFIRKVGPGKALGYDLAPDETYVQPFIKKVLKLKATCTSPHSAPRR